MSSLSMRQRESYVLKNNDANEPDNSGLVALSILFPIMGIIGAVKLSSEKNMQELFIY